MAKPVLRKPKKKVCQFCKEKVSYVDYKDTTLLRKFISDRGKIRARRVTGNCVQHQRDVAIAVKNAREVAGLGGAGDIVEVKDGYGRNFLIPRGFGIRWTKGGERTVESIRAARASREVRDLDHAQEIKAKLEGATVNLPVRAGAGGRLFGAVTVGDIAGAINSAAGEKDAIDKRKIILGNPIKSLGTHQVTVKVHDELDATVNLNVVAG